MKHEKIIKRNDGSRVKINVELTANFRDPASWTWFVEHCAPGKRTWQTAHDVNSYSLRGLPFEQRKQKEREAGLQHATKEEVNEAMLELWQKIKPETL